MRDGEFPSDVNAFYVNIGLLYENSVCVKAPYVCNNLNGYKFVSGY